ncbi:MAG: DEAD/DEAH box helicase, partial [Hyphomicrobiaceae bacterium]
MRPDALTPLYASAQTIAGVGPRVITFLRKALRLPAGVMEPRVIDLIWHTPTGVIDRRAEPTVAGAIPGTIATFKVRVLKHRPSPRGNTKAPYKVSCEDDTGRLDLIFFHAERKFIERQLPEGSERYVSGRVERYGETLQMVHPDYIVAPEARNDLPLLEPVYPLTAGLSAKVLGKIVRAAAQKMPDLDEWQEPTWLAQRGWPSFHDAVTSLHRPVDPGDLSAGGPAWQRLAYDELLAGQLALGLVRQSARQQRGRSLQGDGRIRAQLASVLPFAMTNSQVNAIAEIEADLAAPHRMLRLLQGDVGSGKTVVALMTMAIAVEVGSQAVLMAPTEVLARQHAETIEPLAARAGLTVGLLTGREKGKPRRELAARLAAGEIDILIGTHAVFQ